MMNNKTCERVIQIVRETAGIGAHEPIDADTNLLADGLAFDSVVILELILAVENEFNIEMDPEELVAGEVLKTIGSLTAFIETKTGQD